MARMDYLNALIMEFSRAYEMPEEHIEQTFQKAKEVEENEAFAYWWAVEKLKKETINK